MTRSERSAYPNYEAHYQPGFDWQTDNTSLSSRFERRIEGVTRVVRFTLPLPREGVRASVELGDDGRPRHLLLAVTQERDYATIHPGSKPERNVEEGFFAAWCALDGILSEERVTAGQLAALKARQLTPLTFFAETLGGLLWQGDVRPEFDPFCFAYMKGLLQPREASSRNLLARYARSVGSSSETFRRSMIQATGRRPMIISTPSGPTCSAWAARAGVSQQSPLWYVLA